MYNIYLNLYLSVFYYKFNQFPLVNYLTIFVTDINLY